MQHLILILAVTLLVACGGNTQKKAAIETPPDMHTAETSLDYQGRYTGTFPAADCPGIEVSLTLKADGTYAEHDKYIDRDAEFDEQGGYAVSSNVLTLTSAKGEVSYYKVEENRLRRLDRDKKAIEGPIADCYILTKTPN